MRWPILLVLCAFLLTYAQASRAADICQDKSYTDQLRTEISALTENSPQKSFKITSSWELQDSKRALQFLTNTFSKKKLKSAGDSHPEWLQCTNVECLMLKALKSPEIYYRAFRDNLVYGTYYVDLDQMSLEQVRTISVAQAIAFQYSKEKLRGVGFQITSLEKDVASGLWENGVIKLDPRWVKGDFTGIKTTLHEIGHALDTASSETRRAELLEIKDSNPLTAYAETDAKSAAIESFAEHFSYGFFFPKTVQSSPNQSKNKLSQSWYASEPRTWLDVWYDQNPSFATKFKSAFFTQPANLIRSYFDPKMTGLNSYRVEYNFFKLKDNTTFEHFSDYLSVFNDYAKPAEGPASEAIWKAVQANPVELKQYCDQVSNETFLKELMMIYVLNHPTQ